MGAQCEVRYMRVDPAEVLNDWAGIHVDWLSKRWPDGRDYVVAIEQQDDGRLMVRATLRLSTRTFEAVRPVSSPRDHIAVCAAIDEVFVELKDALPARARVFAPAPVRAT